MIFNAFPLPRLACHLANPSVLALSGNADEIPLLTKAAVLIALAASAQAALAADGTVNFVGKLIDTPCSVSPNSANLTVPLGSVSTTSMNGGVGKRSTPAKFTIDLLNCSPAAGATATVSFTGTADASGNRLRVGVGEASGFATGVSIEIADSAGTPINLGVVGRLSAGGGQQPLRFQASYYSTAATVTAGTGNAVAQFTVAYQ